ncbi:MAG TPA: carboxypeptidase regulatory-like domain-containing protein, partial [Pyrinomonadaceae bacterium]|nr:carboxypeptidase regulatory-like domain-containing protein [Pyrinomonadaceae bacterium]
MSIALAFALAATWLAWGRGMQGASAQTFNSDPAPAASIVKNFESPQVHPLALTPDGKRLLAVNSPNATLSVFQLSSGSPVLTAEIPVGLEPVSVAARNNREAWVVNWLSDSVSIVDLSTGNVTRTIDVGDEPTDILFAGSQREMAFVCVSGGGLQTVSFSQITGGSGVVKVIDPNNQTAAPVVIPIFGKQPRALARSADGSRVFVSVFESGNQTTIVPEKVVSANGGLPPPNPPLAPGLPAPPNTSLIVKFINSQWVDEMNRNWNSAVPYTLADIDLAVIDASGASLPSSLSAQVRGIGTHVGNMTFDPVAQRILVANLEDINQVRFEPNLRGRFQASRVSVLNAPAGTAPTIVGASDLNPHVDFINNPNGSDDVRAQSLAMPADIARAADGTFYVAATSSNRVGVLSSDGAVQSRIGVGQGPTGLAVDDARQRLYVLNRFDETLSVVDTASKSQTAVLAIGFNPEPDSVRVGRRFLYDATNFSSHGTVSCASCHLGGHRDGMVWDLGNPQGSVDNVATFFPAGLNGGSPPAITGADSLHPMKGPMMTQSFRGIIGNEPFHWRGDRAGIENFNGAFTSLLGGPRQLDAGEMAAFKEFLRSLSYPPNPNEFPNRPPVQQTGGFGFFSAFPLDGNVVSCNQCHIVTNFGAGTDNRIVPKDKLVDTQSVKVPQLRGLYQKIGMEKSPGEKMTGFGFAHDGTFDTIFNFQLAAKFNFVSAGSEQTADLWRREMEQMILRLDTGTPPAVGRMVTVNASNKSLFANTNPNPNFPANQIEILLHQANAGNCEVVVRGLFAGSPRSFLRQPNGTFLPDSLSEAPVTLTTLLNAAGAGAELTFIGVPVGEGRMRSIDRDGNGVLNDDEPRTSVSITGRAVNAAGVGIEGAVVTLEGTQAATTVTDAQGRFTFNFVSTTGTHTVSAGPAFSPPSRTFSAPSWNQSATFVTSPTGNASDVSQFFVSQHYADFLNREPDTPGLNFWTIEIESCGSNQPCRDVKRINVSAAFFLSIEFQETSFLAYKAYKASFGDATGNSTFNGAHQLPVPISSFQQLMTDGQRMGRNVVVSPSDDAWKAVLETNKAAFFTGWVQRPDFR